MSNFNVFTVLAKQKLAVFSFLGLFLLAPLASAEMKGFEDFKGQPQLLENHLAKGKWVVAMIWASDCHICNIEAHQYVDFHLLHSDKDATVLGLSIDGASRKKEAEKFIQKHSVDFPNLIAEPEFISELYQKHTGQYFRGTPSFLIFDPNGELKAAQAGAVPTKLIEDFIKKNPIKVVEK